MPPLFAVLSLIYFDFSFPFSSFPALAPPGGYQIVIVFLVYGSGELCHNAFDIPLPSTVDLGK